MNIWLVGSRSFGVAVYHALRKLKTVRVVAVTAPPEDQLAEQAIQNMTPVLDMGLEYIDFYTTDLIVNAQGYAHITSEARAKARHGAIGYHPSLLPRHRGRSSVEWTIAMGDPIAGGTVYLLDDGWDTGPIIVQEFCHVVPGWDASDLWRQALFPLGVRMLKQAVGSIWSKELHRELDAPPWRPQRQDERVATVEPLWPKP